MTNYSHSRTTNTILNFISSMGGQFLYILLQFIVRTVFISTLGKSYLGINGLFSNILSMLSLAEFGVGNAILFKLYNPIAENNQNRIGALMYFYKTVYRYIGFLVLIIGVCLIPFLPHLINDYDRLETLHINAIVIFLLYLLQSVSSYFFFAYKSAIIKANQKGYIITIVNYATTVVSSIIQVVALYLLKNFTIYILILLGQTILNNLVTAHVADRMYPYIKRKPESKLSKEESVGIIKDCGALFLYKLNQIVIKATDNLVLSKFIGLEAVGLYSNYYIFYTTINSFLNKVFDAVVHSFGNLQATSSPQHVYEVFESSNFITAILGATAGVGVFVCSDEFVRVWIGQEWVIAAPFSFLLGLEIYTLAFRKILGRYRNAMGLFQQAKWRPLAGMLINLIVSVALVNMWGICGVIVGTVFADWSTYMWYDPLVLNKYGFKNIYPIWRYYGKFLKYFLLTCVLGALDLYICKNYFTGHGWLSVAIHAFICGITVPCVMIILHLHTKEGKYVLRIVSRYTQKLKKRIK